MSATRTKFENMEDAISYFKEMYPVLPEEVLKNTIEFCIAHPDKMPDDFEKIDLLKPPLPKKEKTINIDDAVKFYENPEDPSIKIIKHRDGACILSAEEAEELQKQINEALEKQDEEKVREYNELWKNRNKKLLKDKLKEKISERQKK